MKYHAPEDVTKVLAIQPPTLRKYAQLLERYGYTFQKNKQGHRWYSDTDVIALQKLIAFKHTGDMDLEAAAQAVLLWAKGSNVSSHDTDEEAIHNGTERNAQPPQIDQAQLLSVLEAQQRTIERMAGQIREQSEQNAAILREVTALRADMKQLNAPDDQQEPPEQKKLPPPVDEQKKRRSFWPWRWWQ